MCLAPPDMDPRTVNQLLFSVAVSFVRMDSEVGQKKVAWLVVLYLGDCYCRPYPCQACPPPGIQGISKFRSRR